MVSACCLIKPKVWDNLGKSFCPFPPSPLGPPCIPDLFTSPNSLLVPTACACLSPTSSSPSGLCHPPPTREEAEPRPQSSREARECGGAQTQQCHPAPPTFWSSTQSLSRCWLWGEIQRRSLSKSHSLTCTCTGHFSHHRSHVVVLRKLAVGSQLSSVQRSRDSESSRKQPSDTGWVSSLEARRPAPQAGGFPRERSAPRILRAEQVWLGGDGWILRVFQAGKGHNLVGKKGSRENGPSNGRRAGEAGQPGTGESFPVQLTGGSAPLTPPHPGRAEEALRPAGGPQDQGNGCEQPAPA